MRPVVRQTWTRPVQPTPGPVPVPDSLGFLRSLLCKDRKTRRLHSADQELAFVDHLLGQVAVQVEEELLVANHLRPPQGAIQALEFLDRHGVTIRRGDLRRINTHRRDLFEGAAADGRESSPVGRPDFKSGWGREPASGGFDSHSLPPSHG